ncbi:MAG: CBS domain-containing protein [Planctomycetaceae bacterium]
MTGSLPQDKLKTISPSGDFVLVQEDKQAAEANRVFSLHNFTNLNGKNQNLTLDELVYVPWCADLATTLERLQQGFVSVAAVVNEYGETIGVITLEDLLDTILMPQPSRTKRLLRRDPILEIGPGKYHVEGLTTLRHFSARFELDFQTNHDGQLIHRRYDVDQLDRLPKLGDHVSWQGLIWCRSCFQSRPVSSARQSATGPLGYF